MAAKYLRRQTWWVRFYHPLTRELIRASLGTHDEARAELLRQRVELEAALLDPRFQVAELSADILVALGNPERLSRLPEEAQTAPHVVTQVTPAHASPKRILLDNALKAYLAFIREENAVRHVENKLSMLRRFIGAARTEQFSENGTDAQRKRRLKDAPLPMKRWRLNFRRCWNTPK